MLIKKYKKPLLVLLIIMGLSVIASYTVFANKAERQASFMAQYTKQLHLTKFKTESDDGAGPANRTSWYSAYYTSTNNSSNLKTGLESALKAQDYNITNNYFDPAPCMKGATDLGIDGLVYTGEDPCDDTKRTTGQQTNSGKPYWVISGSKPGGKVFAEITDVSYSDSPSKKDLNGGKVPHNKVVLYIIFTAE
ncbi:MAG TPA: hypothetical protein VD706_03040 [Candidatus Saccharimonadales bacterium]|nr:hypothetical protein [Candidatus Saccharimonadales bacterium]